MRCEKCPQYSSEPLWNHCAITGAECFYAVDNCDLVYDDGSDNGKFDEIVTFANHPSTVALVRCKDCEYCEVSENTGISRCFKFDFMNELDDYCSYGERKE